MRKTYKYRLFTNASQERELSLMLETHRRLYNAALDGKKLCFETAGTDWSYYEQSAWFKIQRQSNPWFAKLNFWSAQNTLKTLDKAFQAFYRRCKASKKPGYPRFKNTDRFNSFAFDMSGNGGGCKVVGGKLRIQNVGTIRIRWHRELEGKAKQARIVRENGKWFVCFSVELPDPVPTEKTAAIGIDVGLSSFVTTSDGEHTGDSKLLGRQQKELRRRQRALSRSRKGSNTRKKTKKRVTTLHAKVRNTRKDMHHKVARALVDRYGVIAVERLSIKGMLKNRRLGRSISDAAWGLFLGILSSKAESAGGQVISVDAKNTSQQCSNCGEIVKKSLAVRVHRCDCGLVLNRDVNAARNILARALPGIAKPEVVLA